MHQDMLGSITSRCSGKRKSSLGYACLKHRRALEREDKRCSSVLLLSHSKTLTTMPQKLYQFLDERRKTVVNYRPGGRWCHKCRTSYYREIRMVSLFLVIIKTVRFCFELFFFHKARNVMCRCSVLLSVVYNRHNLIEQH